MYFASQRLASDADIYVTTRASVTESWQTPVALAELAMASVQEEDPTLSRDGLDEDQLSNATAAMALGTGPGTFTIGDVDPPQFRKLDAWLDELAIYDVALSAARIAAHHAVAD